MGAARLAGVARYEKVGGALIRGSRAWRCAWGRPRARVDSQGLAVGQDWHGGKKLGGVLVPGNFGEKLGKGDG